MVFDVHALQEIIRVVALLTSANNVCDVVALIQFLELGKFELSGHLQQSSLRQTSYSRDQEAHTRNLEKGRRDEHFPRK